MRDDLLRFLKRDSETRGATILCRYLTIACGRVLWAQYLTLVWSLTDATHIFDGLNDFPTHVAHMHLGTFLMEPKPWPFSNPSAEGIVSVDLGPKPTLYAVALQWLSEDRDRRRALENQGRKRRGARRDDVCGFRRAHRFDWLLM